MASDASRLLLPLLGSSTVAAIFSDEARLQGMLEFEAALAAAEARAGVIPQSAAPSIARKCDAALFDRVALSEATSRAGNPAIPLVKALTALVLADDPDAARFVHWGATSQDAIDTGLMVQLRAALGHIEGELGRLAAALRALTVAYRGTLMVGRTWMQHALPITFGLKVAGWLDAVERHRTRLREMRPRLLVLQFGGAVGTLASLGDRGLAVSAELAAELDLALPDLPWHTQRDRIVELATILGLLVGTLGKIARDLSSMMQTEFGEAYEPAGHGRGGSSTMPHKRNPVACAAVLAAATRAPGLVATLLAAMVQEHERGLGGWHAEWIALPDLVILASGALTQTADVMEALEVDRDRMRANLDATHGLIMAEAIAMALAAPLGRLAAHELVEAACGRALTERRHLRHILAEDATVMTHLSAGALERLFNSGNYLGIAATLIDRVLARSS